MKTNVLAQLNDGQLIQHVLDGELDYFELLMRRNNPFLYRVGRGYGFRHEDIEDLMQETHVNAYANLSKFEGRSSYKTWLTRIMLNQCYQKKKKKSYSKERITMDTFDSTTIPAFQDDAASDTGRLVHRHELNRIVESVLEKMPVEFREVLVLKELNDMTITDTAYSLNISEANVKIRLHRARHMMRQRIEEMYRPGDIFEFNLVYCDAIVKNVMDKIRRQE